MEEAQELGLCRLVYFVGAMDPTNILIAIFGSIAVKEAVHSDVSVPSLHGVIRYSDHNPRWHGGRNPGFDSEHASQEVLKKISSQSNLAP